MNLSERNALLEVVKGMQNPRRFEHTLGVEKEAVALGRIFMPDKLYELALAGLLHDITKDFSTEKQFELCEEYGITVDKSISPKLLHAITGCEFARRKFGADLITDEIYDGIRYHTTGRENMTLFEQLIYLADYIEENRTFQDCLFLRSHFYINIKHCDKFEEKQEILRKSMVLSFNLTLRTLISEGKSIDFDTIKARNYFLEL